MLLYTIGFNGRSFERYAINIIFNTVWWVVKQMKGKQTAFIQNQTDNYMI